MPDVSAVPAVAAVQREPFMIYRCSNPDCFYGALYRASSNPTTCPCGGSLTPTGREWQPGVVGHTVVEAAR